MDVVGPLRTIWIAPLEVRLVRHSAAHVEGGNERERLAGLQRWVWELALALVPYEWIVGTRSVYLEYYFRRCGEALVHDDEAVVGTGQLDQLRCNARSILCLLTLLDEFALLLCQRSSDSLEVKLPSLESARSDERHSRDHERH